jgi:hypothetical protein
MVRRIAKCRSCLKRFCTASGQSLCPLCRPKVKVGVQNKNIATSTVNHKKHDIAFAHNTDQFCGQKRKNTFTSADEDVVLDVGKPDDRDDEVGITDIALTKDHDDDHTLPKKQKISDADATLATSSLKINTKSLNEEAHHDDLQCCITNDSNTIDANDELELDADSSGDLLKQDLLVENDRQIKEKEEEDSCCGSENNDDFLECIEIGDSEEEDGEEDDDEEESDEEIKQQPQVGQPRKTENDVCYICGSNLAGKGLNSRVAHMKRCSTKYGQQTMVGSDEVDIVKPDESSTNWHGKDAGNSTEHVKEKQSVLKQFFKAPVRSLTNVLMNGSRQASKKKPDTTSGKKKQSHRRGFWASNSRRDGQCPSYKRIPGTDFITDGFYYAGSLTQNYFLTHFHSDHYGGITKKWNEGIIYCSVSFSFVSCLDCKTTCFLTHHCMQIPTANLVHQNLGVEQKYLHPLPMNEPTIIYCKDRPVKVTLLDANHCPGAVMFLFEVGNRRVLHVGDFRWNRQIMLQIPQIRALSTLSPRLDELFLDTTYCDKKYQLPTQEEAIAAAVAVAEEEMRKSSKTLFLFGSYTIGKEKIYLSVAQHLKKKVYVDSRRLRILKALGWPNERMAML